MKKIFELSTKVFFLKTIFRLLLLSFLPLVLASCGDKKESAQSCSIQLDEQKYSKVSENENCTNYERASGYLGRAGVSFANFLKTGATDNLTQTLGISKLSSPTEYRTGNREYVTKAQCLIGSETIFTSRSCPDGTRRSGSTDELEISMFANIADFLYLNYGVLDNDEDGTISPTENSGFTKLQTTGISVDGLGTGLSAYNRFEVVAGSSTYIAKSDMTKCVPYTDNYTVDPSAGGDNTCLLLQAAGSVTELRPIFKLDSMTDITFGGTLNTLVSMVKELSMISNALSSDFDSVGISSENSVRKQLTLALSKLDNGAKSNNPPPNEACTAVSLFDVMFLLVKNAADNSTTKSELKSANLINTADLINAVDKSLADKLLPVDASDAMKALPMKSARIVYAKDSPATTYTDSYEEAWSGENSLYEAMKNTRRLGTDDSVKGDGKVTFRELICVAEN
jgi:hypothetical protein